MIRLKHKESKPSVEATFQFNKFSKCSDMAKLEQQLNKYGSQNRTRDLPVIREAR